jgi:hypothetical protein
VSKTVIWATEQDGEGWPVLAHEIVRVEDGGEGGRQERRWSACGREFTAVNHPRGWQWCAPGELPLSGPHDIHCQAQEVTGE